MKANPTPYLFFNKKFNSLRSISSSNGSITLTDNFAYICDKNKIDYGDVHQFSLLSNFSYYDKNNFSNDTALFGPNGNVSMSDCTRIDEKFQKSVVRFNEKYPDEDYMDKLGNQTFVLSFSEEFEEILKSKNKNNKVAIAEMVKNGMTAYLDALDPKNLQKWTWYAGIHTNTDNKHVHITLFAENPKPTRYGQFTTKKDFNKMKQKFMVSVLNDVIGKKEYSKLFKDLGDAEKAVRVDFKDTIKTTDKLFLNEDYEKLKEEILTTRFKNKTMQYNYRSNSEKELIDKIVLTALDPVKLKEYENNLKIIGELHKNYSGTNKTEYYEQKMNRLLNPIRNEVLKQLQKSFEELDRQEIVRYLNKIPRGQNEKEEYTKVWSSFCILMDYSPESFVEGLKEKNLDEKSPMEKHYDSCFEMVKTLNKPRKTRYAKCYPPPKSFDNSFADLKNKLNQLVNEQENEIMNMQRLIQGQTL